jgi:ribosomal protein S27AE
MDFYQNPPDKNKRLYRCPRCQHGNLLWDNLSRYWVCLQCGYILRKEEGEELKRSV